MNAAGWQEDSVHPTKAAALAYVRKQSDPYGAFEYRLGDYLAGLEGWAVMVRPRRRAYGNLPPVPRRGDA